MYPHALQVTSIAEFNEAAEVEKHQVISQTKLPYTKTYLWTLSEVIPVDIIRGVKSGPVCWDRFRPAVSGPVLKRPATKVRS